MKTARALPFVLGVLGCACMPAVAAEFTLTPISASGAHTIVGQEIVLEGGGQTVVLETFLDDWAAVPDLGVCGDQVTTCSVSAQDCPSGPCLANDGLLRGWQFRIDSSGYGGTLIPAIPPCTDNAVVPRLWQHLRHV